MNINKLKILRAICLDEVKDRTLRGICRAAGIKEYPNLAKWHIQSLLFCGFAKTNSKMEIKATKDALKLIEFMEENPKLFTKIERLFSLSPKKTGKVKND